jgi:hypothetical protein
MSDKTSNFKIIRKMLFFRLKNGNFHTFHTKNWQNIT